MGHIHAFGWTVCHACFCCVGVNHDAIVCMVQVAASDTALHLTGLTATKYDNVLPSSVTLGNKATVRVDGLVVPLEC